MIITALEHSHSGHPSISMQRRCRFTFGEMVSFGCIAPAAQMPNDRECLLLLLRHFLHTHTIVAVLYCSLFRRQSFFVVAGSSHWSQSLIHCFVVFAYVTNSIVYFSTWESSGSCEMRIDMRGAHQNLMFREKPFYINK